MKDSMFIGELSLRVGVPTQTIRYYERLGLMRKPERTDSQYRVYLKEDEERLRFIQKAKLFGLSLDEIKSLIDVRCTGSAPCQHLKKIVKKRLDELDIRIQEMVSFRSELANRYEQLDTSNIPSGTRCGFIESEDL